MSTAYNIRNRLAASSNASRSSRLDPGSGGTIIVSPVDRATVVCTGAGTRTLEAAAGVGVGTEILVVSQTNAVIVNSVTLDDGEYAIFRVTLDNSGAEQWTVISSSVLNTIATLTPTDITGDTSSYVEATLLLIIDALVAAGLATDSTTT